MTDIKIITFASGKGGVGKTALAANYARLCSFRCRCLIIDFDFSNQGLSGLLHAYVHPNMQTSRDLFFGPEKAQGREVAKISDTLFFLPAYDPSDTERYSFLSNVVQSDYEHVVSGIAEICTRYSIEVVIIDCHGGLDTSSYFGFRLGSACVLVTEADIVTFNGTLELLDFYMIRTGNSAFREASISEGDQRPIVRDLFIVINRISTRFDYEDLLAAYREQIKENFGTHFNPSFDVFPHDPLLAASFSDYPFYVDLLPESVFVQKLEYLSEEVQEERPKVPGRGLLYRLFERKSRRSIRRLTRSADETRAQLTYTFLFLGQLVLVLILLNATLEDALSPRSAPIYAGRLAVTLMGTVIIALAAVADVSIGRFYRDRLRYEYRLFRKGVRGVETIFVMRLARLMFTRFMLLVFAFILISGFGTASVAMGVALYQGWMESILRFD